MTTGPEELSLNYLLDPAFQLVNTAGRPLTNGWIEVYYHGTRNKYYCASDFDGTLHPFRIPLDSLGSNIVLADPNFSYDIYVYNSFGSLQMSRYNVNPGSGSGGGSSGEGGPAEHWSSDTAGGASTTVTGGTTVYLTLPSSEDQPEFVDHTTDTAIFLKEGLYHIDAVVSFKQDEDDLQNIIKDLVVNTGLMGWDAQMTGQKNWTGPESTDDDRHFLELHTVVSVPEDSLQSLYFQISSPVDLDSAAIEKLDIVKLEAGGNGIKYTGGYGIDISNQVISVSGMMPEASAANFVDNSTYQVDIQNIYETIAETSAMIPSGVATEQFVEDFTSAFITEDALNGYATQDWVVDQGYITSADLPQSVPLVAGEGISIVDTSASTIISCSGAGVSEEWVEEYVSDATSGFITSADIPDVPEDLVTSAELATVSGDIINQIPSLDGYATQQWVEDQGYLTSVPDEYVTQTEMENYTSAFITSADVPQFTQEQADWNEADSSKPDYIKNKPSIPSIEGLASEQYVQDYTSAFITSADVPEPVAYTAGSHIDITNNEISVTGVSGLFAGENVTITTSGGNYYINSTGGDVPVDVVTSAELATVSGDIVSQIPSLDGYATQQWVGEQGYLTEIPPEYVTQTEMENYTSAFITSADIPDVPADVVTSGQLATVSAQIENEIPNYTATLPIAIDDSNDISLQYGNTLTVTNSISTDTAESNSYGDMTLALVGDPSESDNLQISTSNNITVNGTAGNHLRLRIDLDDTDNYINSKVNLRSGSQEITLTGSTQTISGFNTPAGSTWASVFDFSVHPISDMYASQAVHGEVLIELWEYNGDTPVRPWYGAMGMYWPEGTSVEFASSSSKLNVANPMPAPGKANYVLTSNGTGGSYWAPAQGGTSYNGTYPIRVAYNTISLDHDSTLSTKQSSVVIADGEEDGYGNLMFLPLGATPSVSSPCQIQGSTTVQVTGTSDNTVRLRFFDPDRHPYVDMISDLVDELGNPIMLTGGPQALPIRTNETEWQSLFDFSEHTIQELWDLFPTIQLWEYNGDTPVRALISDSWPRGFTINFNSTATTFGVTDPLPNSTASNNGQVLTVVSGAPAWAAPAGGGSEVDIIPSIQTGTKIADYVIDGTSGALYAPAGGGSTYYAGDHIVIDQNNYISTSGLMVENSAFMIDSAGYANRVTEGGAAGTLNLGTLSGSPLQVLGMQDDVEYTLNCSGNTGGIKIYESSIEWDFSTVPTLYPTNNEIKFSKSDFTVVLQQGSNYYLYFVNTDAVYGNNVTLSYGGGGNTRYALVDQLPTSRQLIPSGGTNGQVVTKSSSGPVWTTPFQGIYNSSTAIRPNSVEVVTSLPVSPDAGRIYLIPES